MSAIEIAVDQRHDHLVVRWSDARASGSCRFDHLPGTAPEWLGSADELLEGADRRQETRILEAIGAWAQGAGLSLGLWHDDAGVELLG